MVPEPKRKVPLELVRSGGENYAGVQKQLLSDIATHLPPESFKYVEGEKYTGRGGALSFDLFIRGPAHVLMSHGVADKRYLRMRDEDGERLINRRRHVLVPGPWLKRRLLAARGMTLREDQIHCVGWPRLDRLLRLQARRQERKVTPLRGLLRSLKKPRTRVLWAPTHDVARRGDTSISLSSYPEFEQYLPLLRQKFDVEVSLHPRNRTDKKPTYEQLIDADVVISDFGTMVYEAWALGKPVIFPSWIIGTRIVEFLHRSAEAEIFSEQLGLHAGSIDDVVAMIESATAPDARTIAFLDDYLDRERAGNSSAYVANLLLQLAGQN